jgi:hypothetical protein
VSWTVRVTLQRRVPDAGPLRVRAVVGGGRSFQVKPGEGRLEFVAPAGMTNRSGMLSGKPPPFGQVAGAN